MPKILILTASMGEGHNTAARNIREAILATTSAEVLVADPYTRTNPMVNRLMQRGYSAAINRYPRAWKMVFQLLSKPGVVEGMGPLLSELTTAVRELNQEFKPDIIVSTYPIFSFIVAKIRARSRSPFPPLYTVITDSTQINSAWYRCPCDGSIVADEQTANVLRGDQVPENLIHVLGFPVSLQFEGIQPVAPPQDGKWKAAFFPGGRSKRAIAVLEALATVPSLSVTVIAGKNKAMFDAIQDAKLPLRGELHGWIENMPATMASQHFFIGKAGGATVQEAIAARVPFLVSHVVPGQEEGNISLIEQTGIGCLATGNPARTADLIRGALANNAALWHTWRSNLDALARPSASLAIAKFVLSRIGK